MANASHLNTSKSSIQCVKITEGSINRIHRGKKCVIVYKYYPFSKKALIGGNRGRDRIVDGFTTTYAISAYHL